jgi:tetratricopeptide (TPR) repeat protein
MMLRRFFQPENLDAKRNLIFGERSLRAYFAGGNVRFLRDAEASLSTLKSGDKAYEDAQFYLGVTKAQLRKADESIKIFEGLRDHTEDFQFKTRVALQLAYAHIKKYREQHFHIAETELEKILLAAIERDDEGLKLQTNAMQVFLFSVLSGRPEDGDPRKKLHYAKMATHLGVELLKSVDESSDSATAVRFEALNALGITWMRVGQYQWEEFETDRQTSWERSQAYFDRALELIPNSVRVLQNLTQLRLLQFDLGLKDTRDSGDPERVEAKREELRPLLFEANGYCERSLEVNDEDQFPYLQLAKIANRLGEHLLALHYVAIGESRDGAVSEKDWLKVKEGVGMPRHETPS